MEGHIVGGSYTTIDKFPHAVFLYMKSQRSFCGSSILNQMILLTAAHCVDGISDYKNDVKIDAIAGHEDLSRATVLRTVDRYHRHFLYKEHLKPYDIALMFLDAELPLGKKFHVKRVWLSERFPTHVTEASVSGWGITNDQTRKRPEVLKTVQQKIIDRDTCASSRQFHTGVLCAGDPESLTDRPSRGDSGSALVTTAYQAIGLVSFRMNNVPGLIYYTNLTYFYSWIVTASIENICPEETESSTHNTTKEDETI